MSGFHPYQAVLREQLEERQGTVELVLLEAAYNDDSLKCEAFADHECTVEVVARATWCRAPMLICAKAVENVRSALERKRSNCKGCDRPAEDCWKIRPI